MPQQARRGTTQQRKTGSPGATPTGRRGGRGATGSAAKVAAGLPMLRNSERSTAKRCEFLWDVTYNQKIKPLSEAPALRFGSLIHAALALYYIPGVKRGLHPAKAFKKVYDADMKRNREIFGMKVDEDEKWVNAEELGLAMMENYVDEYGSDSDYEVIVTEHPFETVVMHPETGEPWFLYVGVLDGVWKHRRTREFWIPDHKSTRGIGGTADHPKVPPHLQMDDQAGGYWTFGVDFLIMSGYLKKHNLNGMLYNYLRKSMPDERPSRIVGGKRLYLNKPTKADPQGAVSMKQPSPYFARIPIYRDDYDKQMARKRAVVDFKRLALLRSGELELSKNASMFTCPGCAVRDACELHETGGDMAAFLSQTTEVWDPYAEHEIYDGR